MTQIAHVDAIEGPLSTKGSIPQGGSRQLLSTDTYDGSFSVLPWELLVWIA